MNQKIEVPAEEKPEGLDWFENRLEQAMEAANFRAPIDWQKYGPLFLELYKRAKFHVSFYPADESPLADQVREIEGQFKWEVRR